MAPNVMPTAATASSGCSAAAGWVRSGRRTIRISIPLAPDYTCQTTVGEPENRWGKVEYEDTDANANETTTWGVTLVGDPVHLIE